MKFLHISDLHLGRRLGAFSLAEEQTAMLDWVFDTLVSTGADVLLIAGDIYDRAVPPPDAVVALDHFFSRVHALGIPVCVSSGNHDSVERLSFGSTLFTGANVYVSPPLSEGIRHVTFTDEYGDVTVWLLPFCRPADVRDAGIAEVYSYTEALAAVVGTMPLDPAIRNVALAHQFLTGGVRADSETASVGGLDNVDAAVFSPFDYTALGHLHRRQNTASEKIAYSGSPLCYDFGEAEDEKGAILAELLEKGTLHTAFLPYRNPMRRLRTLRGTYDELTAKSFWQNERRDDYLHVILTDPDEVPDAAAKLSVLYPHLLLLSYENHPDVLQTGLEETALSGERSASPGEVFAAFFARQNGRELSEAESAYIASVLTRKGESDETL